MAFMEKKLKIYGGIIEDRFWGILSYHISPEYINRHPEKPWDRNPVKPWDRFRCDWSIYCNQLELDQHPTLIEVETKIWEIDDYNGTPQHDCETCEDNRPLYEHEHFEWFEQMSCNKNLTLDFLEYYWGRPWNLFYLASNPLTAAKEEFKKEYMAALKIQEMFLQAKYNPAYAYCRRLHSEFYQSVCL
jgi:hypothetical protein